MRDLEFSRQICPDDDRFVIVTYRTYRAPLADDLDYIGSWSGRSAKSRILKTILVMSAGFARACGLRDFSMALEDICVHLLGQIDDEREVPIPVDRTQTH